MQKKTKNVIGKIALNISHLPPFLLQIINYSVKGWNKWTALLKELCYSNSNLQVRERKREDELDLNKNIFFDNKLKWFQYQISRGTLKPI